MNSKLLLRRSYSGVMASVFSGIVLFVVFRASVELAGVEIVGLWALIQGLMLLARLPDSGIGANVTRLVAADRGQHGMATSAVVLASLFVSTIPILVLGFALRFPIAAYVSSRYALQIGGDLIDSMVWIALLAGVASSIATISLSVVEGVGGLEIRNWTVSGSYIFTLLLVIPLLSALGVIGVAVVNSLAAFFQAIAGVYLLWRHRGSLQERSSVRGAVREIWRENLQLNGIGLLRLTFEPLTKVALSGNGGLGLIAVFELALKVTTQMRVLMQAAMQPLLVLGARPNVDASPQQTLAFKLADRVASVGWVAMLSVLFAMGPLVAWVGLGSWSMEFGLTYVLLAVGSSLNAAGLAGYYFQLSAGVLIPLVRVQMLMAITNSMGALIALLIGLPWVGIAGYSIAFAYGGLASRALLSTRWWSLLGAQGGSAVGILSISSLWFASWFFGVRSVSVIIWGCVLALVLCMGYILISLQTLRQFRMESADAY